MSWRRASCIIDMFRFKFNEIDGIKKACLKTYMRQKWSRQVLLHHLFTSTSSQHLGSTRFFYGIHVAHLCGLQFCVFFYFACLSTLYLFENISFTLSNSIIISMYYNDWVIYFYKYYSMILTYISGLLNCWKRFPLSLICYYSVALY
jgi:hypothetical protein